MDKIKQYCLIKGTGMGKYAISSFDSALLSAGVGNYNLVRVSSILPPGCQRSRTISSPLGSVLFTAYATLTTKEVTKIASAVAVAIPKEPTECGVIMEYSDNTDKDIAINIVEHLAEEAMYKRGISYREIVSIGVELDTDGTLFFTTFAGIGLFD